MNVVPLRAALALPTLQLSDDERSILGKLHAKLARARKANELKQLHWEGKHKAKSLDIAVPPQLADLEVSVPFAETVVGVLAERIEWDRWISTGGDLMGLDRVFAENSLDVEGPAVVLDSLITGMSFVSVGTGEPGEPDVLVTGESPNACTDLWDPRTRRSRAALSQTIEDGVVVAESLYLPNQTIRLERARRGAQPTIDRDEHNLNRVPVVRFPNMARLTDVDGRSEITRPVRYWSNHAARTAVGMEIHREFFTAPQRYGLGVDPSQFGIDESSPKSERIRKGWEISMTRMNFLPRDEDTGELPSVGQFSSSPPTPYIDEIKFCAQQIAAAAGLPATYMGFTTENPPSGDSIRMLESRLIKRAQFRQRMFGRSWREVARLALLVRDTTVDEEQFAKISPNWINPATPTPGSQADRTGKLVASGVLTPDSRVTYREAGISEQDADQLDIDKRRATGRAVVANLANAARDAAADPTVTDLADRRGNVTV